MAKKRFTDGLSDLFDNPFDHPSGETTGQGTEEVGEDEVRFDVDIPVKTTKARRKISGKGFTGDLDNFLGDSFERERQAAPSRRRRSGLDFLIRSTVQEDEDRPPQGEKVKDTKRVTLIFRKDHLAELKEIAKERKVYLKDLVGEMVEKFLDK